MCFSNPNSKVLTSKGWIPICQIKENDLVLTHLGKFSRVSKKIVHSVTNANERVITGEYMYDNRGKTLKIAGVNCFVLTQEGWDLIYNVNTGISVKMLGNECKTCKVLIPFYRNYCSKSCSSTKTATAQHSNPEHKKKLSEKRLKLINDNGGKIPWLNEYLKSGRNKENIIRNPKNIELHKIALARLVESGNHVFQREDIQKKARTAIGKTNKLSSFIERKMMWLLDQKGIEYIHNMPFERNEKTKTGRSKFYYIDIVLKGHKIAIEIDGEYWHKDKEADLIRQREIEDKGYIILRFTGEQVRNGLNECSLEIDRILKNHKGEYRYMDFTIENTYTREILKPNVTLYSLEVSKYGSYIVDGFVVSTEVKQKELF